MLSCKSHFEVSKFDFLQKYDLQHNEIHTHPKTTCHRGGFFLCHAKVLIVYIRKKVDNIYNTNNNINTG